MTTLIMVFIIFAQENSEKTLMRWPTSIGCVSLRKSKRSSSWHIKSSTNLHQSTSALSHVSPTYPVADRCVLSAPIAWWCLSADCRLLVAELFRSSARRHGMTSRKTWHQQNHWPHFVASATHTCSGSLFLTTCWTST